jgi:hypothetical protein
MGMKCESRSLQLMKLCLECEIEWVWIGMLKFGLVRFSGVFAWTVNQNWMVGRGCVEPQTKPAEPGLNLVWTELNLQFFIDILSCKKEHREVLTSVFYAGKHVGGTCQVRNACLVVASILTPAWHWRCRHFRVMGVTETCLVKFSRLHYPMLGLSTVTIYGYDHTVYGWLTGTNCPVHVPYIDFPEASTVRRRCLGGCHTDHTGATGGLVHIRTRFEGWTYPKMNKVY